MKFIPILFSTEMVQAVLENRKKQTRQTKGLDQINKNPIEWNYAGLGTNPNDESDKRLYVFFKKQDCETWTSVLCPYGIVGDVFWVRETFASEGFIDNYIYKADNVLHETDYGRWKPSIFMPKEACRIFLKIKSIKVERLQDISEEDAIAEGCSLYGPFDEFRGALREKGGAMKYNAFKEAWSAFKNIWETINSEESWKSNPWVWIIEFERIEEPENFN